MSLFLKTNNQIKMALVKIYTKKINLYFLEENLGLFSMRLGNNSTRTEQKRQKIMKKLLFLKEDLKSNRLETIRIKWNP